MFMNLGMKLDNFLVSVREWNTQRIWYKLYAHYFIKKKIKANAFIDEDHFKWFVDRVADGNQIYEWQYKLLHEAYKKSKEWGK